MIRSSLLALCLVAVPAIAAAQAPSLATPAVPPAKATDKKVCRTFGKTGSRLGGERICLTPAQWRAKEDADREWLDDAARVRRIPG